MLHIAIQNANVISVRLSVRLSVTVVSSPLWLGTLSRRDCELYIRPISNTEDPELNSFIYANRTNYNTYNSQHYAQAYLQGRRSWGFGVLSPLKYTGGVRVCFDPLSFKNCCWITPQVPHHKGWKTLSKMEGKTNFSTRLQAVRNRDCWVFVNHWRRV